MSSLSKKEAGIFLHSIPLGQSVGALWTGADRGVIPDSPPAIFYTICVVDFCVFHRRSL